MKNPQKTIAVAAAEDADVLMALKKARDLNLARTILVGNKTRIQELAETVEFDLAGLS
jgi:phosphate butyryltransferase